METIEWMDGHGMEGEEKEDLKMKDKKEWNE